MAAFLFCLAAALGDGNLLANGGFEELAGERPVRWDVFVAPFPAKAGESPEAASASVTQTAAEGARGVTLRNPQAYPTEPYNNWSQNVIAPLGGKTLEVSGQIKTEDVQGGAGIWVQCWRKNPLRVVGIANTATEFPCYGTADWTAVHAKVEIPSEAEFITVRCVLKGSGQAWFDDIDLRLEEKAPPSAKADDAEATPESDAPDAAPDTAEPRMHDHVDEELAALREANLMLAEALEAVREDNRRLLEDLLALRENMRQLQESLAAGDSQTGSLIPPLVPADFDEKALQ
ncbi:MAG: hypothetical protein GC168_02680 [Candidatus Hydrogenedens sp.]|nr:hypothetical protein [Candidatus Hydrogenedens sp.]